MRGWKEAVYLVDVIFPRIQTTKKEHSTMTDNTVIEFKDRETRTVALSEILWTGAQHLIHQAEQAELEGLLLQHANRVIIDVKAAVDRNGFLPVREILTGLGPVTIRSPRWVPGRVSRSLSDLFLSNGSSGTGGKLSHPNFHHSKKKSCPIQDWLTSRPKGFTSYP